LRVGRFGTRAGRANTREVADQRVGAVVAGEVRFTGPFAVFEFGGVLRVHVDGRQLRVSSTESDEKGSRVGFHVGSPSDR